MSGAEQRPSHRRILVVDDDVELSVLLSESLETLGEYAVMAVRDGATGLARVFEWLPDCIVADVRMPGLNGYQFVRALRGDPATADIPIIVLSALAQEREQLAGLLTGADIYLVKPVTLDHLLDAIERVLALSAAQRQARMRKLAHPADDAPDTQR